MVVKSLVRKNEYRDSIFLMRISKRLEELEGVQKASAIMATDANKDLLRDAGMLTDEIKGASSNDLVIVIDAVSFERAVVAISGAEGILAEAAKKRVEKAEVIYKTLDSAIGAEAESNLVLISVPGEFAAIFCGGSYHILFWGHVIRVSEVHIPVVQTVE